jgi:hypothetical protein
MMLMPMPPTATTAAFAASQFRAVSHSPACKHCATEDGRCSRGNPSEWVTSVAGTTEYSASPAIEYIAIGDPSRRRSRVVPSYNVPFRRFIAKKLSHRSSRPAPHGVQNPHGMMNAETTFVPTAGLLTPGPSAATVPEISCPITAGVGNATSAFMTCRSV